VYEARRTKNDELVAERDVNVNKRAALTDQRRVRDFGAFRSCLAGGNEFNGATKGGARRKGKRTENTAMEAFRVLYGSRHGLQELLGALSRSNRRNEGCGRSASLELVLAGSFPSTVDCL
jgi:hypothetical protein